MNDRMEIKADFQQQLRALYSLVRKSYKHRRQTQLLREDAYQDVVIRFFMLFFFS